jgi:hypothetical protein
LKISLNCENDDGGQKINHLELFSLACTFDVEELKEIYEGIVIGNMNEQSALEALKIGNLYKSNKMIEAAFSQIKKMLPNEVQSEALKHKPGRIEEIFKFKKMIEELNKEEFTN